MYSGCWCDDPLAKELLKLCEDNSISNQAFEDLLRDIADGSVVWWILDFLDIKMGYGCQLNRRLDPLLRNRLLYLPENIKPHSKTANGRFAFLLPLHSKLVAKDNLYFMKILSPYTTMKVKTELLVMRACLLYGFRRTFWVFLDSGFYQLRNTKNYDEYQHCLYLLFRTFAKWPFRRFVKEDPSLTAAVVEFSGVYQGQYFHLESKMAENEVVDHESAMCSKIYRAIDEITKHAIIYPGMQYIGKEAHAEQLNREHGKEELPPILIGAIVIVALFTLLLGTSGAYQGAFPSGLNGGGHKPEMAVEKKKSEDLSSPP